MLEQLFVHMPKVLLLHIDGSQNLQKTYYSISVFNWTQETTVEQFDADRKVQCNTDWSYTAGSLLAREGV